MIKRLNIGGEDHKDGWENMNIQPGPYVDYLGDAANLLIPNETYDEVYASHVLEHIKEEPHKILSEWYRVLKEGGTLYVSVPDMNYLCTLYLSAKELRDRIKIMQVIFGGHVDAYDYHVVGYDEDTLRNVLGTAGFKHIQRVEGFELFKDCSEIKVNNKSISVNLTAKKGTIDRVVSLETTL